MMLLCYRGGEEPVAGDECAQSDRHDGSHHVHGRQWT